MKQQTGAASSLEETSSHRPEAVTQRPVCALFAATTGQYFSGMIRRKAFRYPVRRFLHIDHARIRICSGSRLGAWRRELHKRPGTICRHGLESDHGQGCKLLMDYRTQEGPYLGIGRACLHALTDPDVPGNSDAGTFIEMDCLGDYAMVAGGGFDVQSGMARPRISGGMFLPEQGNWM